MQGSSSFPSSRLLKKAIKLPKSQPRQRFFRVLLPKDRQIDTYGIRDQHLAVGAGQPSRHYQQTKGQRLCSIKLGGCSKYVWLEGLQTRRQTGKLHGDVRRQAGQSFLVAVDLVLQRVKAPAENLQPLLNSVYQGCAAAVGDRQRGNTILAGHSS